MTIKQLNDKFAIDGKVSIAEGRGGLPMVHVTADKAAAVISTHAGQVLSYKPTGREDLLFLSEKAYYADGKAIKGGVPVCWPWFGPDPEGRGRPGHGLVRNRGWNLLGTEALGDGSVAVKLGLSDTEDTRAVWPQSFELEMAVTVGETLTTALTTRNKGTEAFPLTQGLHTYLRVGDIAKVRVTGLEGVSYMDNLDNKVEKVQDGPVTVNAAMERLYINAGGVMVLEDEALGRHVTITSGGSKSSLIWSPWAETAAEMADLEDDDYKYLLCVETINAGQDVINVAAGASHTLSAAYRVS